MTLDLNSYLEYDVRAYFEQYTDFDNKSVLDFGCNRSNFIRYKPHNNYTGIDVIKEVIDKNKIEFPNYTFKHYDGYNYMYNKNGTQELSLNKHYDVCVAFSVFTHMTIEETIPIIKKLKQHCDTLYLTYYSNKDKHAYDAICKFRDIEPNMWDSISTLDKFYIKTDDFIWSFYNDEYLQKQLGGNLYDTTKSKKTLPGMQRCLII